MATATLNIEATKAREIVINVGAERLPEHDIFAMARNWNAGTGKALARLADPFMSRHWLNEPVARKQEKLMIPALAPVRLRELAGVAA